MDSEPRDAPLIAALLMYESRVLSPHDPGHLAATARRSGDALYSGFRFNPLDLPPEFRTPDRYRDYLFENTVPGYVVDEPKMRRSHERGERSLRVREWRATDEARHQALREEMTPSPAPRGRYSFNPERHDCDNCVTWAVRLFVRVLGVDIPLPREGRIKEAVRIFDAAGEDKPKDGG